MLKKQLLVFLILMFSIATIVLANEAYSGDWKNRAIKKTIENRYHHLGDFYIGDFVIPEPEGTYWEKSFWLRKSVLNYKKIAFIKFIAHHIDFSDLIVNGHRITLNSVEESNIQNFFVYIIPIPFEILLQGENIIGIETNRWDTGNYDDIEFGQLEIWFQ